jgi:plasmid stability protein
MGAMTLRNLPPEVVATLRLRARREGRSLNALICEILTREARDEERRERSRKQRPRMEALRHEIYRRHGEGTPAEQLIREDRDR